MIGLFENFYNYYYLVLILQGICVFHSIRRGNQSKWIWIIVFLPLIGCVAYVFTEIIKKRHISGFQSGVVSIVNPGGRVKDLEKRFRFSDTFANRVALADAYLASGLNEKAIELYEPALTGVFNDNEHVIKQLITAYYKIERYNDITVMAPRIKNTMNFSKSTTNLLYAISLEKTGKHHLSEQEYKAMNHRFSNYEARYRYGDFLLKNNRKEEAALIFHDVVDEAQHLDRREKGASKEWIDRSKEEWTKLMS